MRTKEGLNEQRRSTKLEAIRAHGRLVLLHNSKLLFSKDEERSPKVSQIKLRTYSRMDLLTKEVLYQGSPCFNRVLLSFQLYLTELASSEKEGIEGQLNHATCIINALSDIKPEIENVIKMGRKIVESEATLQDKENLSKKIDALKKDFNDTGSEVEMPPTITLSLKGI